jgi:hypothetical protein
LLNASPQKLTAALSSLCTSRDFRIVNLKVILASGVVVAAGSALSFLPTTQPPDRVRLAAPQSPAALRDTSDPGLEPHRIKAAGNGPPVPERNAGALANRFAPSKEDPAARQLMVQAALASDQPGFATNAALAIGHCMALEAAGDGLRTALSAPVPGLTAGDIMSALAWQEDELRKCQALDALSRSQWIPLIRRSLREGGTGAAAALLGPVMGSPYEKTVATEVADHLRRDARQCHELSLLSLVGRSDWKRALVSVEEQAAYLQTLKRMYDARHDPMAELWTLPGLLPETPVDSAQVLRIASEIEAKC